MKRISLLAVLLAGVLASGLSGAEGPNTLDLDGRDVVLRLYQCGTEDPEAFKRTSLQLNGETVIFNFVNADEHTFVVIFGEDQRDELVWQVLGNHVYGWAYQKGLEFRLLQKVPGGKQTDCDLTFVDGLGNPIPHANVEIYLKSKDKRVLIGRRQLDEKGRLGGIPCRGKTSARLKVGTRAAGYYFNVSHPDYGAAFVEQTSLRNYNIYYIPLVPNGSEADKRSIWGQVLDPNAKPVAGASIYGIAIITLGGDWIRSVSGQKQGAVTDQAGGFRMYLPVWEQAHQVGIMVPPKTRYQVKVEPPEGTNLLLSWPEIMNGQSSRIKLQYAGYFHTFAFEDANGLITESEALEDMRVVFRRSGKHNDIRLKYIQWKDGAWLPLGRYGVSHKEYRFEDIEVTADSPERLVFRAGPSKIYRGWVVNGVTREPMEGAFVVTSKGCDGRSSLAYLSEQEWATLHGLQKIPPIEKGFEFQSAKSRMEVLFDFASLVRTDVRGRFEVNLPTRTQVERLVVFEEDYLAYHLPTSWAREDINGVWVLPEAKLFPAAKVSVRPDFAVDPNRRAMLGLPGWFLMGPQWFIDKENSPGWAEKLLGACGEEADEGVFRGNRLAIVQIQGDYRSHRFQVPAGVSLQLNLRSLNNVEWGPLTVAGNVKLQQGQLTDLGRHKIVEPFAVFVEVVNSEGSPVEGVPVVVCGGYDPAVSSTDENGIAVFDFVGYSKGEFIVEYKGDDPTAPQLREAIPYEVTRQEDANSVFTMRVSDEMLYRLFK